MGLIVISRSHYGNGLRASLHPARRQNPLDACCKSASSEFVIAILSLVQNVMALCCSSNPSYDKDHASLANFKEAAFAEVEMMIGVIFAR